MNELIYVSLTLLYVVLGVGVNNLSRRLGVEIPAIVDILLWPVSLIIVAFDWSE